MPDTLALGPLVFGAPLALAALIVLPIIWFVLRATPPAPRSEDLPSLRLLDSLTSREETPDKTPWWVLLLRLSAAAAALVGLAQPVLAPPSTTAQLTPGPLLVVIDDGWSSAPRWSELINAAETAIESAPRDTPVHILLTAPRERPVDPAERYSKQDATALLDGLEPVSWRGDRADAVARLADSGLSPSQIFYASNGLSDGADLSAIDRLSDIGPLRVYPALPRAAHGLTALIAGADGVSLTVRRVRDEDAAEAAVSALTIDGAPLATTAISFAAGESETTARFELPGGALAQVSRFKVTGSQSAGLTWLWDSADRNRRVGLASTGGSAQPLLSDVHYVRRALEPFATLIEGDLADLILQQPDAIILTDIGTITATDLGALSEWIDNGGALIRFAGPRLAAQNDPLLPVPLRRTSRALGGALAWDDPQALAPFGETSPFYGLTVPSDSRVRQQVLAQPTADLQARTWANLADGSPVVTAARRGSGTLILFHITAGPDWSDLPFSAVFPQMLRRAIAAGRGAVPEDADGLYAPQLTLDGFGRLEVAPSTAAPLTGMDFDTVQPSQSHPPGYYTGPSGTRALNAAAGDRMTQISAWPAGVQLIGESESRRLDLTGWLIAAALILLAIDSLLALALSGRLAGPSRAKALAVPLIAMASLGFIEAEAQMLVPRGEDGLSKAEAAAINMRFAYVETGNDALDRRTEAGLLGLSRILWMRTSVEPVAPHGVDLETDELEVYPLIYYAIPGNTGPLSDPAIAALNRYIRTGGALVIDTSGGSDAGPFELGDLADFLSGLDAPPLAPVTDEHVLTRSFYLIDDFPGRFERRRLWIESTGDGGDVQGDGVSRLFIGDADWAGAWAIGDRARPLFSVDGGPTQREMSYRFGVNLVMYVLTGNYKADQVHLPALLERLGDNPVSDEPLDLDALPPLQDGGPR